jgi:outer membrane protein OmpA-like peptidoglycan-associated protein
MDIYLSKLQAGNSWGKPVNLGKSVNTPLNEDTPFISDNDSLLFFSSQGHENIGGYDIFVSRLETTGTWSKPVNLGYPVNTTDDDLFYFPWRNNEVGIISRITSDGFGKEDIYALQDYDDKDFGTIMAEIIGVNMPAEKTENLVSVRDDKANEPAYQETASFPEPVKTIDSQSPAETLKVSSNEIEIDPVYFGFDNFQLSEAGKKQLEKICGYLDEFKGFRIKLTGHSDAKGPAGYNLKLSEKRAAVAKEYLTLKGIDALRIEIVGMGEMNFAAVNSNPDGSDNPEGRRLNRRVEYEISDAQDNPIIIRMTPVPSQLKFRQ